jgi:hypothetical protein
MKKRNPSYGQTERPTGALVGAGSLWPRKQRANKELKDGNLEKI